jgi:hypothetical protein
LRFFLQRSGQTISVLEKHGSQVKCLTIFGPETRRKETTGKNKTLDGSGIQNLIPPPKKKETPSIFSVEQIYLVQIKGQCRAVVVTVINTRVPENAWKFLTSSRSASFRKKKETVLSS